MRKILVLCLGLGLSACASTPNPISTVTLYDIEAGYDTALHIAAIYMAAPICAPGTSPTLATPCGVPAVRHVIRVQGRRAQAAVLALRSFVRNNPTLNPASALAAAQNAIATFQLAISATQ